MASLPLIFLFFILEMNLSLICPSLHTCAKHFSVLGAKNIKRVHKTNFKDRKLQLERSLPWVQPWKKGFKCCL